MELSPQDRERIYLEEKARLEARERVIAERRANPTWKAAMLAGVFLSLSSLAVPVVERAIPRLFTGLDTTDVMVAVVFMGAAVFLVGMFLWARS